MNLVGHYPWWLLLFFAVGVLATATAFVTLFFALGRRPERMWATEIDEVGSAGFIRSVAALLGVPVRQGGNATLLNNGDEWLPSMLADFVAAEQSITFSAYIWEPGVVSDTIIEALIDRARAGIQVRVLLDGLGAFRSPGEGIDRLKEAGARVDVFRPFSLGKIMRFHKRNHRRAIVIDGRIGYTGGMAVGDKWLGSARNPQEWRDTMVRVSGCLAENLQSAFAELWAYVTGEVLTGEAFFPSFNEDPSSARSLGIVSSPASEDHPLRLFYFLTFLAARERLWITTPYFVPDKHTRRVLANRARAGVDVRLLLPNELTDAKPIRWAARSYYSEMLKAGVRVFEYQPTFIHAKHVVVDGTWSVVGSANMDIRSKELNFENVLGILDAGLAQQLEATFERDLEHATEITPALWKHRGIGVRIAERIAVFFAEQY